jgi:hypothetical protein
MHKLYWVVCCTHSGEEGEYIESSGKPQTEAEARDDFDEPVAGFETFDEAYDFAAKLEAMVGL